MQSMQEIPGLGLIVWDERGRVLRANARFLAIVGRSGDLAGQDYWTMTAAGQKQRELNLILNSSGEPFEKEFIRGDGRLVTTRLFPGCRQDERGERVYFAYVDEAKAIGGGDPRLVERTLRYQNAILLDLAKNEAIDSGDIDLAMGLVTEAGAAGLRCSRCSAWLYGEERSKIVCRDLFHYETGQHERGGELHERDFPHYFRALAEDRTIAANHAHTHPAMREFAAYLAANGISSMLVAPIRQHGKLLGVLCNEHIGPPTAFSQEEQNFAGAIADIVSRVLQAAERHQAELALQRANEELEAQVRARTASLQLVLDSMGDGLLVCELSGALARERSRIICEWFGPYAPGMLLWDYLAPADPQLHLNLRLGFEQMAADFLPFELAAQQMPTRMTWSGRDFRLSYKQVFEGDVFCRVVLIVRDITAELANERSEQVQRELATIMGHLLKNRDGFIAFVEESGRLLECLAAPDGSWGEKLRHLHTLKGNTAIYGFQAFSTLCHELEDQAARDPESGLNGASIARLQEQWRTALEPLHSFLHLEEEPAIRIFDEEHRDFIRRLEARDSHSTLLELSRSWQRERIAYLLSPYRAQAERIARQLGKEVEVVIEHYGLRLPDPSFRPFFSSLIHCLRNALDHGIEDPATRERLGKPRRGLIVLSSAIKDEALVVSVEDDGGGIRWDAVRRKALARGLPADTREDLERALFFDGFSTRDDVTALSGRGVGLAATLDLCLSLGGHVQIASTPERGTRIRFIFPGVGGPIDAAWRPSLAPRAPGRTRPIVS